MEQHTKESLIVCVVSSIILISITVGACLFVKYRVDESEQKFNAKIMDNIVLSKPFNKVVDIDSDIVCCSEYMYDVSILVTTDEYPDPQWIYDFRYNSRTDELFYDDNIQGIGVKND